MKTTIRDIDILKSINPLEVASYLKVQGWQKQSQISDLMVGKNLAGFFPTVRMTI